METYDFYPDKEEPLVKSFINKFGGRFIMSIHGTAEYIAKNDKTYSIQETVEEFWDLMQESVKTGKNGFLKYPKYVNMPKHALI